MGCGVQWLLHCLDDFLFFGALETSEVSLAALLAAGVFAGADIPVASHKTEGPSTSVTFLGLLLTRCSSSCGFHLRRSPGCRTWSSIDATNGRAPTKSLSPS